jgi:ankyrin repeat protein
VLESFLQDGTYGTALQVASIWGVPEIVKLLLESGADVNIKGEDIFFDTEVLELLS